MAVPHALSALIEKRAEMSGEIAQLEERLGQLRASLVHLDSTIRLFEPTFRPEVIAPKAKRERAGWFSEGDLPRIVLDILRLAPEPLTVREITLVVMERRGFSANDEVTLRTVEKRVNGALRRREGVAERVPLGPRAVGWRARE
jgi:hypothetical protein